MTICASYSTGLLRLTVHFYDDDFYSEVKEKKDAGGKLNSIDTKAKQLGYSLYLIVDEYDNFTNVIFSQDGADALKLLTHTSGFYREYFKVFKPMFSRILMLGVSPVTLHLIVLQFRGAELSGASNCKNTAGALPAMGDAPSSSYL